MAIFENFVRWFLGGRKDTSNESEEPAGEVAQAQAIDARDSAPAAAPSSADNGERLARPNICSPAGKNGDVRTLMLAVKGDKGGKFTDRFASILEPAQLLEVIRSDREIALGGGGHPVPDAQETAELVKELETREADICLWSRAEKGGLRIGFVAPQTDRKTDPGYLSPRDFLLIPFDFGADLATLVYASLLSVAIPVKPAERGTVASYLEGALGRLTELIEQPPEGLSPAQTASVCVAYGLCATTLWHVTRTDHYLTQATGAFEAAIEKGPKEMTASLMSLMHGHLGWARETAADASGDNAWLVKAEDAYRIASEALDPKKNRDDWAEAHVRLGGVLSKLAKARYEDYIYADAVAAYTDALSVYSKAGMPKRWAKIQTQRAVTLLLWGTGEAGSHELEQSVEAFQDILGVYDRETDPLHWAYVSNHLGTAIFALAKRQNEMAMLNDAQACFDGSIAVYERYGQAKAVEVIRRNLHRVERLRETRSAAAET